MSETIDAPQEPPAQIESSTSTIPEQDQNNMETALPESSYGSPQPHSTINTSSGDATTDAAASEALARELGLRRSRRVPKPRTDLVLLDEDAGPPRTKRTQAKKSNAKKGKVTKSMEEQSKAKAKAKAKEKEELARRKAAELKAKQREKEREKTAEQHQEPAIDLQSWTPNVPLLSSDFKSQQSVLSRLKNPNMKPLPYGGDIMKIMEFINKFHLYMDSDLLNVSFQTFEVGLDLYPEELKTNSRTKVALTTDTKDRDVLYQDYMSIKDVIRSQDKMNLLLLTLLELLFTNPQKYKPPTMSDVKSNSPYRSWVVKLRSHATEWGYPAEWQANRDSVGKRIATFPDDDTGPAVDPTHPEILTPNIYQWTSPAPLPIESNPLFENNLFHEGVLALKPHDRIVLLKALVNWCLSYSQLIRGEIYHLSHLKRSSPFGVQTQHVPRYYFEGSQVTFNRFRKLCSLVQIRYEIRREKRHFKKQLRQGKNEELRRKLEILDSIKEDLKGVSKEERNELTISFYSKWNELFDKEVPDNPLTNPFEDPVYTLRSQEFFIGRVPHVGDFYLPRLHTYDSSFPMNTYTDLRGFLDILSKFNKGEYIVSDLFESFGQSMSAEFKVLYHDTPSLVHDVASGRDTSKRVYWYEMCHNTQTLDEFLKFLDYKIAKPPEKSETPESNSTKNGEELVSGLEAHKDVALTAGKKTEEDPLINKNPLPRDAKYNSSRNKLRILKEYLSDYRTMLHCFEELKEQYGDMKPGRRQSRRFQKRVINYNEEEDDTSF